MMLWNTNVGGIPSLLTTHAAAEEWLTEKDVMRLDMTKIQRPNTKWVFHRWVQVEVKAILVVDQPLFGQGSLPDWLRNKKGLYAQDTFNDNLCLFRRIAVHHGARPDCCTEKAIELAKQFWTEEAIELLKQLWGPTTCRYRSYAPWSSQNLKRPKKSLNSAFVCTNQVRMVPGS